MNNIRQRATQRIDISDGYAEIYQNGLLNRNYILRDWLGTPRVTLDGSGTVVQATDIDPYGRVMDLRSYVAGAEADRYRFTGHEHDAESGYDYHGARYELPPNMMEKNQSTKPQAIPIQRKEMFSLYLG
jgi:uncharacterized protein RhaS with RHS repeats